MIRIEENIYEIELSDIKPYFYERRIDSHKGMFGIVGIIGGSLEYTGSIKLANMSAASLRSGPGIVRVIADYSLSNAITPYLLEQTFFPLRDGSYDEVNMACSKLRALAIGMGWDDSKKNEDILIRILNTFENPIVIDATGLNILSRIDKNVLLESKGSIVLTPHMKEFSRLINLSIEEIEKNKICIAKDFAKKYNVILLLKGSTTIITDGVDVYLTKTGNPGMAKGGSGDVLDGILVGLLGYNEFNILTVATAAFVAGLAGEMAAMKYTDIAALASDTIKFIPDAIKYIRCFDE